VLVDARPSYDAAIRHTVPLYLEHCLGFAGPSAGVVTEAHVQALKQAGGFNNDWHASYALLRRILSRAPIALDAPSIEAEAPLASVLTALRAVGHRSGLCVAALVQAAALEELGPALRAAGGGIDAIDAVCGTRHAELVRFGGDLARSDLVTRLFQEVYLGSERLRRHHGLAPLLGEREGLWRRERSLLPDGLARRLAAAFRLAVVTGRPRQEAALALERVGLLGSIAALGSEDDAEEETRRRRAAGVHPAHAGKPDPYLLHLVLDRLGSGRAALVGDLPDDIQAARAARSRGAAILALGATWGADDPTHARHRLLAAGADAVLDNPEQLLALDGT